MENKNALANEVYICNYYADGSVIYPIAGSQVDNYVFMATMDTIGVPSDDKLNDNRFSGANCYLEVEGQSWKVKATHTYTNGKDSYKEHSSRAKVLIIRIS